MLSPQRVRGCFDNVCANNQYSSAVGHLFGRMGGGKVQVWRQNSNVLYQLVKEGYFVVVGSNSQIQIWSGKQDKYPIMAQGSSVAAVIKDIGVLIYFEALLEAQLPLILLRHWFSTNAGGRDLPRNNKNYFLRLCRFCCSLFHRPARPASN